MSLVVSFFEGFDLGWGWGVYGVRGVEGWVDVSQVGFFFLF